mgnify:CR=1 FL=1
MMKRHTLQARKAQARTGVVPDIHATHALIDHGLEALDLIEGGTTLANQYKEIKVGLADVRKQIELIDNAQTHDEPYMAEQFRKRALYMLDLVAGMLTTDYRRYPTWADVRQQVDEEFDS